MSEEDTMLAEGLVWCACVCGSASSGMLAKISPEVRMHVGRMLCAGAAEELGMAGGAESLRRHLTPAKERPNVRDDRNAACPGRHRQGAPRHIGKHLWVVRGTRADAAQALLRLQRRVAT